MRVSISVSVVLVAVLLMSSIPVQAHHSLQAFWNQDQTIQITGVVKKVNIINPHSLFIIEVTEPNGEKTEWTGVTASVTAMFRANWRSDTLEIGTEVTVSGASPKKAGAKGILIETFTLPDGRILTPTKID